jgi:hypothetical protein
MSVTVTVWESRRWNVPIPERGPVLDHHLTGHTLIAERSSLAEAQADVRALGEDCNRKGFVMERTHWVQGPALGCEDSYGEPHRESIWDQPRFGCARNGEDDIQSRAYFPMERR